MLRALTAGLIAVSLPFPLAGPADEPAVPSERLVVTVPVPHGSACDDPADVTIDVADDNGTITITYGPKHRAVVGVGVSPTDGRKVCGLSMRTAIPVGHAFAVAETEHVGEASVMAGATATFRASTYAAGGYPPSEQRYSVAGPYEGPWAASLVAEPSSLSWLGCGSQRSDTLATDARVVAGTSDPKTTTSFLSTHRTTYRLSWRQCPST